MYRYYFLTGLFLLALTGKVSASDTEIDACATAPDKMLCVAKVFNRKLDLLTSSVSSVSIIYFDENNCTTPWGSATIAATSLNNQIILQSVCSGLAEQVKNFQTNNSTIESVQLGTGSCISGLSLSRHDSAAVIADCISRLKAN